VQPIVAAIKIWFFFMGIFLLLLKIKVLAIALIGSEVVLAEGV
jgi:hypothetical protein